MIINNELILKLESLSRLRLEDEERKEIKNDLENILDMFEKLKELNTDNVPPLVYINQEKHILRADIVANELSKAEALKNASENQNGYFKVPKVIDK